MTAMREVFAASAASHISSDISQTIYFHAVTSNLGGMADVFRLTLKVVGKLFRLERPCRRFRLRNCAALGGLQPEQHTTVIREKPCLSSNELIPSGLCAC
jgi:hypothetical protein